MWRLTAFLVRNPELSRDEFVVRWRNLFESIAARHSTAARLGRSAAGGIRRLVMNLPVVPASQPLIAMFGDAFDGVGELWFDSAADAAAALSELNGDEVLRKAAQNCLDGSQSLHWLGQVFPQYEAPGAGIKFLVAGETADGWTIEEAQRYWREVHPPLFRGVADLMTYITRYVQTHGRDFPNLRDFDWLGHYKLYPMCADMGFRNIEDVATAYSLPSYLAIVRPDELKFSKQGEMLSFASEHEVDLLN